MVRHLGNDSNMSVLLNRVFSSLLAVVALSLSVDHQEGAAWSDVSITLPASLPPFGPQLSCSVPSDHSAVIAEGKRSIRVRCSNGTEIMQCGGERVEPLDVSVRDVCGNHTIPLYAASHARLVTQSSETVQAEWLEVSPEGRTRVVAQRSLDVTKDTQLPILNHSDRYLRVTRGNASPVTVSAEDLLAPGGWTLPKRRPGGEILGLLRPSAIEPLAYRLTGPNQDTNLSGRRYFSVQGLESGSHSIMAVYESGLTGRGTSVDVLAGTSRVIVLEPEDIGAVTIAATPALCANGTELVIWRIHELQQASITRVRVARIADLSPCRWYVDGLPIGEYEASLHTSKGLGGSRGFTITSQQVTMLGISPSAVSARGRVSKDGKPLVGASITFIPSHGGVGSEAVSDEDGVYSLVLADEGDYTTTLKASGIFEMKGARLRRGANTIDWTINQKGTIYVRVVDFVRDMELRIQLRGIGPSAMWSIKSPDAEGNAVTWEGLTAGTYEVSATQSQLVSDVKTVVIDANHSSASIDLILHSNTSRLWVRDDRGGPILDPVFYPGSPRPALIGPGLYSLEGVAPGTKLRVSGRGLVPVCRVVPRDGDAEVILGIGRATVLWLEKLGSTAASVILNGILVFPGSDCPIPLTEFGAIQVTGTDLRIRVDRLPSVDGIRLVTSDGVYQLSWSADGTVMLTRPPP